MKFKDKTALAKSTRKKGRYDTKEMTSDEGCIRRGEQWRERVDNREGEKLVVGEGDAGLALVRHVERARLSVALLRRCCDARRSDISFRCKNSSEKGAKKRGTSEKGGRSEKGRERSMIGIETNRGE